MFQVIQIFFINLSTSQNRDTPYVSNKNICDICKCKGSAIRKSDYFILDCTNKNLTRLFNGWPEVFGRNLSGNKNAMN